MKNDTLAIFIATAINMVMFFTVAVPALGMAGDDEEETPEEPQPEFNHTETQLHVLRRVTDADTSGPEHCSRHYICQP